MPQNFLHLVETLIFYAFLKRASFVARPSKRENGPSEIICTHRFGCFII